MKEFDLDDEAMARNNSKELFGDGAILTALSGREELSKPFEFMLTIASPKLNLQPGEVIGKPFPNQINFKSEGPSNRSLSKSNDSPL